MTKQWKILNQVEIAKGDAVEEVILQALLTQRGFTTPADQESFLQPLDPTELTAEMVGIDPLQIDLAVERIERAIANQESIIVYADYDADGVTAGAILWETLFGLGAKVLPYIPHRQEEGYGLSKIGIDSLIKDHGVQLIVTVDQGISAADKVAYAKEQGIDVVVTDHHTKPDVLPDCPIIHTTKLSGSGVSWFLAKTLIESEQFLPVRDLDLYDLVGLSAIGTIADLLPLIGPNRSIASFGLEALRATDRPGIRAMLEEAGIHERPITVYDISHVLAPRINALGRLEHALDALRLLCTTSQDRAKTLAARLAAVNKERQSITVESSAHAKTAVGKTNQVKDQKIIIQADPSYNPGIIGLIAGKLVEEHFLPAIVLSQGEEVSKASARSIRGFNIVEAIKAQSDLLVDVGGHPMAAGFTIETKNLPLFIERMQTFATEHITAAMLVKQLTIDLELPLRYINTALYQAIQLLAPFGMGNYEPVFAAYRVTVLECNKVGADQKHLKLKLKGNNGGVFGAIAFSMADKAVGLEVGKTIDIAYTVSLNSWNGKESLDLKLKDIH